HSDSLAVAQAELVVPRLISRPQQFAFFSPRVVNECLLAQTRQHVRACVDALATMNALDLIRRSANIDSHMAYAHTFLALDAIAVLVPVMHDQRVPVVQHALQISIRTTRGAATMA